MNKSLKFGKREEQVKFKVRTKGQVLIITTLLKALYFELVIMFFRNMAGVLDRVSGWASTVSKTLFLRLY